MSNRGYFGIGIEMPKTESNIGTLWRSAAIMGAAFIFTIGRRYKKQASDTMSAWKHIPLFEYQDFDAFLYGLPRASKLIGVELTDDAIPIADFVHPERCTYLLGAEDNGLSSRAQRACHEVIILPGTYCMNVSVAGSIVMYDRMVKPKTGWASK